MSSSAFKRNVAEHLGFGIAADLKQKRIELTALQLELMHKWIANCEVTWLLCDSDAHAYSLEKQIKAEFKPPLTKR